MKFNKILFIMAILFFMLPIQTIYAENFTWPSDGFIGYKYYSESKNSWDIDSRYHTGIDIWGRQDGGWNNQISGQSNPIYPAFPGTIIALPTDGVIIKHHNTLYTKYWHVKDKSVNINQSVDVNTIIGYQTHGSNNSVVHVHMTVASSSAGTDIDYTVDPSAYFGVQLDNRKVNPVPWMYKVTRPNNSCGGTNVVLSNQNISGSFLCSATSSITILPNTTITGEQKYFII